MHIKEAFGKVARGINERFNLVVVSSPELDKLIREILKGNVPEVNVPGRSPEQTYVEIYGEREARISVPLTKPECRSDGGPLWEKSFFVFPDENGELKITVEGTFSTDGKDWPY